MRPDVRNSVEYLDPKIGSPKHRHAATKAVLDRGSRPLGAERRNPWSNSYCRFSENAPTIPPRSNTPPASSWLGP